MRVFALDIATTTGWCVSDGKDYECGAKSLEPSERHLTGIERHSRIFDEMTTWMAEMLSEYKPAAVVVESAHVRFASAAPVLYGLRAQVLVVCWWNAIVVDEMTPAQWRSVAKKIGWDGAKSDETDAARLAAAWFTSQRTELN